MFGTFAFATAPYAGGGTDTTRIWNSVSRASNADYNSVSRASDASYNAVTRAPDESWTLDQRPN